MKLGPASVVFFGLAVVACRRGAEVSPASSSRTTSAGETRAASVPGRAPSARAAAHARDPRADDDGASAPRTGRCAPGALKPSIALVEALRKPTPDTSPARTPHGGTVHLVSPPVLTAADLASVVSFASSSTEPLPVAVTDSAAEVPGAAALANALADEPRTSPGLRLTVATGKQQKFRDWVADAYRRRAMLALVDGDRVLYTLNVSRTLGTTFAVPGLQAGELCTTVLGP